jgi:integrase
VSNAGKPSTSTTPDLTAVLKAAEESRYHPVLVLIAATGLRKGGALALHWQNVDLDAGALKVVATVMRIDGRLVISEPKTDRSRRVVPLAPVVVAMLRRQRTEQKAERLRAGNQWTDSGLVFTTEFGGPVDPRNLLRVMESAAKAAGVDGVGVHTLRHSAAVGWLEAGVHIKAVADLLGYSSIAVTGDVYVRPHKRRHGASGGRWPGRAAGALRMCWESDSACLRD